MTRALWLAFAAVPVAALAATLLLDEPWWTADQRGRRLVDAGRYEEAAEVFASAPWRGAALYRAKRFEAAADALSGVPGPEAAYNRGTALVFLGRYEEAVEAFERALAERPDWADARTNRDVAASRIRGPAAVGEATEIGADEVVFD